MPETKAFYLPSATEGKVWRMSVYKPDGRPAYATATEGTLETRDGWQSFSCMLDCSKTDPATRVSIQGPATAKKKAAALALAGQLLEVLSEAFVW